MRLMGHRPPCTALTMKTLLSSGWVPGLLARGPGNGIACGGNSGGGEGYADAGAAAALQGGTSCRRFLSRVTRACPRDSGRKGVTSS